MSRRFVYYVSNCEGRQFVLPLPSFRVFVSLYLSHLIRVFFIFPLLLVSISHITKMASSGSHDTGRTPSEGTSVPSTPSSIVHISSFSSCLRYRLYPIQVVFSLLYKP